MINILNELERTAGRNDKIVILQSHKDNTLLKRVLLLALCPYTQFYIKKMPQYESSAATLPLADALDKLGQLSTRSVTGHAAINHLKGILEAVSVDDAIVIERIVGKDLRCGIQESTVNKVFPSLIPTYPCLLARTGEEKNIKNITFKAVSQLKSDGTRINFICNKMAVESRGRSGKEVSFFGMLDETFNALETAYGKPCVFDGELLVEDSNGTIMERKRGNGIITKAIRGTISKEEAAMIRVQLWDVIPYDDFIKNVCNIPYGERYASLIALFPTPSVEQMVIDVLSGKVPLVEVVETLFVNSFDECLAHYESLRSRGYEGSIIKNLSGKWEDKRSKDLVKLKAEEEADLVVVGWSEGKGQFADKMGALLCQTSDGKIEVSVSGFSESLRDEITATIDDWIGAIITVRYNEKISGKGKTKDSLFLPRFVERRYDKYIANSADELK